MHPLAARQKSSRNRAGGAIYRSLDSRGSLSEAPDNQRRTQYSPGAETKETDWKLHEELTQPRSGSAALHQVPQDLSNLFRLGDHGKNPHRLQVKGAPGRAALVYLGNEPSPGGATFSVRNSLGRFFHPRLKCQLGILENGLRSILQ